MLLLSLQALPKHVNARCRGGLGRCLTAKRLQVQFLGPKRALCMDIGRSPCLHGFSMASSHNQKPCSLGLAGSSKIAQVRADGCLSLRVGPGCDGLGGGLVSHGHDGVQKTCDTKCRGCGHGKQMGG